VIWRSVIVAGYIALAIVIGVAYGTRGLFILSFFYFWAGAWVVFLLAWGWAAHALAAGTSTDWIALALHREPNGSRAQTDPLTGWGAVRR
jgi:hypothetical protein